MYRIATLNKISEVGLEKFTELYEIFDGSEDLEDATGVLVRSQKMHDMEFKDELLAIARAGAGVNNIPVDKCADEGIVVFNTPGANANSVKELVLGSLIFSARNLDDAILWTKSLKNDPNVQDMSKTVESGKSEMVIQSVHSAKVGDYVGMKVDPDNIHIMIAEDHTNYFTVDINENFRLEFNGKPLDTSVTKIIKGSRRNEDGTLVDANGEPIDPVRTRIVAAIEPQDIKMTDHVEEGLVDGCISNLIYKGDHYSYVIRTELEQDFIVDDEYLWNMDDHVGLIMPVEKMNFRVKK